MDTGIRTPIGGVSKSPSDIESIRQAAERMICALQKAGVSGGYEQLKGRRYEFIRILSERENKWTGTISEVSLSDDGFLKLSVAEKFFSGIPITGFQHTEQGWIIQLSVGQSYPGELRFL
ncbi:MAG: hypothetical protein AAB472_01685 [Patescibacteria group bacterium]